MLAAPFGPSAMCFLRPARGFGWPDPSLNRPATTAPRSHHDTHHPRSCRNAALRLKLGTPRAWRSLPGIHEAINGKRCPEHHLP